jgi:hypothetical protein
MLFASTVVIPCRFPKPLHSTTSHVHVYAAAAILMLHPTCNCNRLLYCGRHADQLPCCHPKALGRQQRHETCQDQRDVRGRVPTAMYVWTASNKTSTWCRKSTHYAAVASQRHENVHILCIHPVTHVQAAACQQHTHRTTQAMQHILADVKCTYDSQPPAERPSRRGTTFLHHTTTGVWPAGMTLSTAQYDKSHCHRHCSASSSCCILQLQNNLNTPT